MENPLLYMWHERNRLMEEAKRRRGVLPVSEDDDAELLLQEAAAIEREIMRRKPKSVSDAAAMAELLLYYAEFSMNGDSSEVQLMRNLASGLSRLALQLEKHETVDG